MTRPPIRDEPTLLGEITLRLQQLISGGQSVLISIDGLGGTGKTRLAAKVAQIAGGHVISLDQYVIPHRGTYLPHLRYEDIERELNAAATPTPAVVIIEGLYVRSVLSQLGAKADISIYIRRIDQYGAWMDEFYYSEGNDLQEMLDTFARMERLPGEADDDREAVRYQILEKPISSADLVYDRPILMPPTEPASA